MFELLILSVKAESGVDPIFPFLNADSLISPASKRMRPQIKVAAITPTVAQLERDLIAERVRNESFNKGRSDGSSNAKI